MNIHERMLQLRKLLPPDETMVDLTIHEDLSTTTIVLEFSEGGGKDGLCSVAVTGLDPDDADRRLRRLLGPAKR